MIEYGTNGAASPGGTCYAPRWEWFGGPQELCDRDRHHTGRHAAWRLEWRSRVYWPRTESGEQEKK